MVKLALLKIPDDLPTLAAVGRIGTSLTATAPMSSLASNRDQEMSSASCTPMDV